MSQETSLSAPNQHSNLAAHHKPPAPTIWPAALALGATFLAWGLISSLIISLIGLALFAIALGKWIGEIRHERKS
ncbi:MAG TPA: hypothetical protein VNT26_13610 [Candidatus Sulfotelmatobacter sp.]|nr:hypothetical protein [Candidatus Sulfotelmatobacter sp.]HWI60120.1 hypothetical protein [Bacillota bacterium]